MESYPPLFRESFITKNPNPNPPNLQPDLDVPLIDLSHLNPTQLGQACREFGFFRLTNHGIPSSLSTDLFAESKKMLSAPFESKEAGLFMKPANYFWGTPALSLIMSSVNWVEGLHVPLDQIQGSGEDAEGLDRDSSFRSLVNQYGQHMTRIARTVTEALAIDVGLDRNLSASYISESDGFLRAYRYPCCPDTSKYPGMVAHTDSSVLSILNQDEVKGLQILHNNQWFNLAPIPDTLVVNVGDLLQAMSDNEYKSVMHRVAANETRERMSLCYFAFPREDFPIVSSKYRPFTNKEFRARVKEDNKAFGCKVGLEHFRIKSSSR